VGRLLTAFATALAATGLVYFLSERLLAFHYRLSIWMLDICRIPITGSQSVEVFAPIGSAPAAMTRVFHSTDEPVRIAILFVCAMLGLLIIHRRVELARNFLVFVMILIMAAAGVLVFDPAFEIDSRTFTQIWLRGETLVWLLLPWFSAGLYALIQPALWRGFAWALAVQGYGLVWSAVRLAYCLAVIYYSGPLFALLLWFGLGLLADVLYLIVFFSLLTQPAAARTWGRRLTWQS